MCSLARASLRRELSNGSIIDTLRPSCYNRFLSDFSRPLGPDLFHPGCRAFLSADSPHPHEIFSYIRRQSFSSHGSIILYSLCELQEVFS
jgi:hypothetical protein